MALALGMTVVEAKSRMGPAEAMRWGEYFHKYGYASPSRGVIPEIQRGFALLTSTLINVNGGYKNGQKAKMDDFLPKRETEREGSEEEIATLLKSLWVGKKGPDRPAKSIWRRARKKGAQ